MNETLTDNIAWHLGCWVAKAEPLSPDYFVLTCPLCSVHGSHHVLVLGPEEPPCCLPHLSLICHLCG